MSDAATATIKITSVEEEGLKIKVDVDFYPKPEDVNGGDVPISHRIAMGLCVILQEKKLGVLLPTAGEQKCES